MNKVIFILYPLLFVYFNFIGQITDVYLTRVLHQQSQNSPPEGNGV